MYFVHSYEFIPEDKNVISATTDYSSNIVCSVEKENIFGTQFHPEKSDKIGLQQWLFIKIVLDVEKKIYLEVPVVINL